MSAMVAGEWTEDPDLEDVPDDAQISQADKLRVGIEFFAEHGYPNNRYCTLNALRDGIWEFKKGRVRISFFDTDGEGNFAPKSKIQDRREADFPDDEAHWQIPQFDPLIRLGHCFGKTTEKTEEEDIIMTLQVREEDIAHDRQ